MDASRLGGNASGFVLGAQLPSLVYVAFSVHDVLMQRFEKCMIPMFRILTLGCLGMPTFVTPELRYFKREFFHRCLRSFLISELARLAQ